VVGKHRGGIAPEVQGLFGVGAEEQVGVRPGEQAEQCILP
jgi:hypothetical protein